MGVILSKGAYKKTKRVVTQATSTPLGTRGATGRRVSQGQGGVSISEHPFKVKEDGQNISIGGGKITVTEYDQSSGTEYGIPAEVLDLSSISASTTIYVYSKVPIVRASGNDYLNKPTLTIGSSNANFNESLFPNDDLTNYFSPIATVVITVVDSVKSFVINQIEFNDKDIYGPNMHPWRINAIYDTKTSDTAAETQYKYFVNSGNITTPEGAQNLASDSGVVGLTSLLQWYTKTTSDLATDGYRENYNTTLESWASSNLPADSISLGSINSGSISQSRSEDIISDGRVY
jgi:hypothetical protein